MPPPPNEDTVHLQHELDKLTEQIEWKLKWYVWSYIPQLLDNPHTNSLPWPAMASMRACRFGPKAAIRQMAHPQ